MLDLKEETGSKHHYTGIHLNLTLSLERRELNISPHLYQAGSLFFKNRRRGPHATRPGRRIGAQRGASAD